MADDKSVSPNHYTINQPEFVAFKKFADTEPMCEGWTARDEMGWVCVSVPNWTAKVKDFYKMLESHMGEEPPFVERQATWFEGINPEVAKRKGLTAPQNIPTFN